MFKYAHITAGFAFSVQVLFSRAGDNPKYFAIALFHSVSDRKELCSDSVRPDELFRNGALGNVTKVSQKGTIFKFDIHAVTETVVLLANERVLVYPEWVPDLSTTGLEALERRHAHTLSESERAE